MDAIVGLLVDVDGDADNDLQDPTTYGYGDAGFAIVWEGSVTSVRIQVAVICYSAVNGGDT